MKYKTNKVKVDIGSYIHYWRGTKKVGKTTLFYDLLKEQYGDYNKGLLISIGSETGYQALDGLVYAEAPMWDDLEEIVDDLCENKSDNDFEIVAFDTCDELIKLAQAKVIAIDRKKTGKAHEFNACLGGYGQPRKKVEELIDDILARVRRCGYGIIVIGHSKLKDVKEKSGEEYQQLSSNLSADYDGIFANKADIVMTIITEKDVKDGKVEGTERYMYFRSDGFIDCGSRFPTMPDRIKYGAKNYIDVFETGVKGSIKTEDKSDKAIEKRKKAEKKARAEEAEKYIKVSKESAVDEDRNEELKTKIQSGFGDMEDDVADTFKAKMEEFGITSFKDVSEIPTKHLEELVSIMDGEKE